MNARVLETTHGARDVLLGEVVCDRIAFVRERAVRIDDATHRQLVALFGRGYGDRVFTLEHDGLRLDGCTIDEEGSDGCIVTFLRRSGTQA